MLQLNSWRNEPLELASYVASLFGSQRRRRRRRLLCDACVHESPSSRHNELIWSSQKFSQIPFHLLFAGGRRSVFESRFIWKGNQPPLLQPVQPRRAAIQQAPLGTMVPLVERDQDLICIIHLAMALTALPTSGTTLMEAPNLIPMVWAIQAGREVETKAISTLTVRTMMMKVPAKLPPWVWTAQLVSNLPPNPASGLQRASIACRALGLLVARPSPPRQPHRLPASPPQTMTIQWPRFWPPIGSVEPPPSLPPVEELSSRQPTFTTCPKGQLWDVIPKTRTIL